VYLDNSKFSFNPIPGGWIWDDIGNYYGAGHWGLNWHENQYDLLMQPGKSEGDDVKIIRTDPELQNATLFNLIKTGKKGSGDNGYIFLPPYSSYGFVEGTIPQQEKEFSISGAFTSSSNQLSFVVEKLFSKSNIIVKEKFITDQSPFSKPSTIFYKHYSPSLDSINYYFLKRSINLYGEALIKTMAYEKTSFGNTDSGVAIIKKYWQDRGIEKSALHIMDGSGLSPQNRVTAHSLVTALQYAKTRDWFNSFYFDLPEYNQMKLKSGSIGGARSFAGYHTAKDGTQYTVAVIVNNYDGSSSSVVNKMFLILNELK
jgi:D-alanyl-D-alanine carboxypeptidase/D-alanyl-D-alanine-endopeptidase (penicillin-binding protein 4)